jgi:hypothetical protein
MMTVIVARHASGHDLTRLGTVASPRQLTYEADEGVARYKKPSSPVKI